MAISSHIHFYYASVNKEALNALIDIELWDKQFQKALEATDLALKLDPKNINILYEKAQILKEL